MSTDKTFDQWFNDNINISKQVYNEMASDFRTFVYNKLYESGNQRKRTPKLDEAIDNAVLFRFGIIDIAPTYDDDTVTSVLSSLMYGNSLPKTLINKFLTKCNNSNLALDFKKQLKKQVLHNLNTKFDHW